eukprot:5633871-Alexandrium_andersonii.AAC.1
MPSTSPGPCAPLPRSPLCASSEVPLRCPTRGRPSGSRPRTEARPSVGRSAAARGRSCRAPPAPAP